MSIPVAESRVFVAEIRGRDKISARLSGNGFELEVVGCQDLLALVRSLQKKYGANNVQTWQEPTGHSHSEILIREIIQKVNGKFHFPYEHAELCHCRNVTAELVDQAIVAGAHTAEKVSRQTSASTACGTCRPDVQKVIDFRLKKSV